MANCVYFCFFYPVVFQESHLDLCFTFFLLLKYTLRIWTLIIGFFPYLSLSPLAFQLLLWFSNFAFALVFLSMLYPSDSCKYLVSNHDLLYIFPPLVGCIMPTAFAVSFQ